MRPENYTSWLSPGRAARPVGRHADHDHGNPSAEKVGNPIVDGRRAAVNERLVPFIRDTVAGGECPGPDRGP